MILALGVMLLSSDCSPDPILEITTEANINLVASYGSQPFLAQQPYNYDNGSSIQIEQFSFYISDVVFLKEIASPSSETEIKEITFLDFSSINNATDAAKGITISSVDIPVGEYQGIKFGIGVSSELNRTKPSEYSEEHPLSLVTMYQDDFGSYTFCQLEGQIDQDNDGMADSSFAYHAATDNLFREQIFASKFTLSENSTFNLKLNIDIERLLGTVGSRIDVANHPTDSNFNISQLIADNFAAAISVE